MGPRPVFDLTSIGDCQQNPKLGSDTNYLSQSSPIVHSNYFGKRLKLDHFERSLSMSSLSLIHALYDLGVETLKISSSSPANCRYFGFLNPAPQTLQNLWQQYQGGSSLELLGLFRTQFRRDSQSGQVQIQRPVILLREDTDRWTLLHEQTHFLFAQARAQEPFMIFTEELSQDADQKFRQLRMAEQKYIQQGQNARQILQLFETYLEINNQLFYRGPLEEFSIESMLSEKEMAGEIFPHVFAQNLSHALFYMQSNSQPTTQAWRSLLRTLDRYQNQLFNDEPQVIQNHIDSLRKNIQEHMDFVEQKIAQVQDHLIHSGIPIRERSLSMDDHPHYDFELLKKQLRQIHELNNEVPVL
jgi:hypothetical protein